MEASAIILGELLYYNERTKNFNEIPEEEKKKWFKRAVGVYSALDKMNLMTVPKVDINKVNLDKRKDFNALVITIQTFMKKIKTTKPNLFPCEELAYKILEENK